jgi:hypothetical protein
MRAFLEKRLYIPVAAVVNATLHSLLRGRMELWLATLLPAICFGTLIAVSVYFRERLREQGVINPPKPN